MRSAPFLLAAALACFLAPVAGARDCRQSNCWVNLSDDEFVRCGERHSGDVRFAITTEERNAVLLVTDRVVAMQLSDRVFNRLERKMKSADDGDEDTIGRAIKTAVYAAVRSLLDHSIECDLSDVTAADYRNGELIITTRDGEHLFAGSEIEDEDVMRSFSPSDARAFVQELRRRMARVQ